MKLVVVKSGFETFDALHAYGLAVLIADSIGVRVTLRDKGLAYEIVGSSVCDPPHKYRTLDEVLALPKSDDLSEANEVELANLDGLAALSFTSPGVRVISLDDLETKRRFNRSVVQESLTKAQRLLNRILTASSVAGPQQFIESVQHNYRRDTAQSPLLRAKPSKGLGPNMPIDAAFACSTRRPFSDGAVSIRTNVAVAEPRHASVLAHIGAARFLRAHRVGADQVNLYVPLFDSLQLDPGFGLARITAVDFPARQAALIQLLSVYLSFGNRLAALSCQTLQVQGAKQSVSIWRDRLPTSFLVKCDDVGHGLVLAHWLDYLSTSLRYDTHSQDLLCEAIKSGSRTSWQRHLDDFARLALARVDNGSKYVYWSSEVSFFMSSESNEETALSSVMRREQGTLRFGRSLRSLGEYRRADLRDSLDEIEGAVTRDQLVRALALSAQRCVLAKAAFNYVIVPSDADLGFLLDDIERWGVRDIASLLIILASLRYPTQASATNGTISTYSDEPDYYI